MLNHGFIDDNYFRYFTSAFDMVRLSRLAWSIFGKYVGNLIQNLRGGNASKQSMTLSAICFFARPIDSLGEYENISVK